MLWLNGGLVDAAEARIDPSDRGLALGDGLFETIRADGPVPRHAGRHLARLRLGAGLLQIPVPFDDAALCAAMRAVLEAANLPEAALRLTLTRGPAPRGLAAPAAPRPTLLIAASPLPEALPPARMIIARCTRRNEFSPLSSIKSLNYLDSILARNEAAALGADDAILLNTSGALAGASAATLVLRLDGAWCTPRLQDGALAGIARGLRLELGQMVERRLVPEDAARAEAAWLLSSLSVRVVFSIGEKMLSKAGLLF